MVHYLRYYLNYSTKQDIWNNMHSIICKSSFATDTNNIWVKSFRLQYKLHMYLFSNYVSLVTMYLVACANGLAMIIIITITI